MKKKTTTKKTPKRRRAKAVAGPIIRAADVEYQLEMRRRLAKKVMVIAERCPGFETMGVGVEDGKEKGEGIQFGYTTARQVFEEYAKLCREVGLWYRQVDCRLTITLRQVFAESQFELVDVDTGHSVMFAGAGQGNNGVWAVNSAQTVALKQALLELFMAFWTEAEDKGREKVDYFQAFKAIQSPAELMDEMAKVFDEYKIMRDKDAVKDHERKEKTNGKSKQHSTH